MMGRLRHSTYTYTGTKVPCQGVNDELQEGPRGTVARMTPNGCGEAARARRSPSELFDRFLARRGLRISRLMR
jgi:hypothetical protein